jgi:hypothetical protein
MNKATTNIVKCLTAENHSSPEPFAVMPASSQTATAGSKPAAVLSG